MKIQNIKKSIKYLVPAALFVFPLVVNAGLLVSTDCNATLGQACGITDVNVLVKNIVNIVLGVAGMIAVLFVIIGGFRYVTSAGNEEQAEAGKKTLQNAIIGVVIIVLSFVIVNVISTALRGVSST